MSARQDLRNATEDSKKQKIAKDSLLRFFLFSISVEIRGFEPLPVYPVFTDVSFQISAEPPNCTLSYMRLHLQRTLKQM